MYREDIDRVLSAYKTQAQAIGKRYNIDPQTVLEDMQKETLNMSFDKTHTVKKVVKLAKKTARITRFFMAYLTVFAILKNVSPLSVYTGVRNILELEIRTLKRREEE